MKLLPQTRPGFLWRIPIPKRRPSPLCRTLESLEPRQLFAAVAVDALGRSVIDLMTDPSDEGIAEGVSMPHLLFVRGGLNTGGFNEGGPNDDDDNLSSLSDFESDFGWGEFGQSLINAGYQFTEVREGDPANTVGNIPIPFATMDLSVYDGIVMASNNAVYSADAIDAIEQYAINGGGVLFISDAGFGEGWNDAPDSDQQFLDRFGWTMQQDRASYSVERSLGEFTLPDHPILDGIDSFEGVGVSPVVIPETDLPGVTSTIVVRAKNSTRNNDSPDPMTPGSSRSTTDQDAAVATATVGNGHIVGFFDRNPFFNANGDGTDLYQRDHQQLALNLMAFLTDAGDTLAGDFDQDGALTVTDLDLLCANLGSTPAPNDPFDLDDNGVLDSSDVVFWVENLAGTAMGDANLDGQVNLLDLDIVGANFNQSGAWHLGDFNCDGVVNLLDLDTIGAGFGAPTAFAALTITPISLVSFAPRSLTGTGPSGIEASPMRSLLDPNGPDALRR